MRTHLVLPEDLVAEVDRIAGKRRRSKFIAEVVEQELRRMRQRAAFEAARGMLQGREADYPHWATPEKTSEWVRKMRDEWDQRLARKWSREI